MCLSAQCTRSVPCTWHSPLHTALTKTHPMNVIRRAALATLVAVSAGAQAPDPARLRDAVGRYRRAHEAEILQEFRDLLAIPNLASDSANIRRNADAIVALLVRRGVTAQLLASPQGGPPAVFGELRTRGATRTVVLYAHYDGQP